MNTEGETSQLGQSHQNHRHGGAVLHERTLLRSGPSSQPVILRHEEPLTFGGRRRRGARATGSAPPSPSEKVRGSSFLRMTGLEEVPERGHFHLLARWPCDCGAPRAIRRSVPDHPSVFICVHWWFTFPSLLFSGVAKVAETKGASSGKTPSEDCTARRTAGSRRRARSFAARMRSA